MCVCVLHAQRELCHLFQFCCINEPVPIPGVKLIRFSELERRGEGPPVKYFESFSQLCRVVLVFCLKPSSLNGIGLILPHIASCIRPHVASFSSFVVTFPYSSYLLHLFPHHLHELVKVKFPVSVHVVLNDKAEHLQIDQRRKSADQLPTQLIGHQ